MSETEPAERATADPFRVRASHLLRSRAIWMIPVVVGSIVVALMSLFYIGSVVDPTSHLSGLPVSIVNQDRGTIGDGKRVDFGAELEAGLTRSPQVAKPLGLHVESLRSAERRMNRGDSFATLVIPANFTASLLALDGKSFWSAARGVGKPTIELLTNLRAGSLGVSLASTVLQKAVAHASAEIGDQLTASAHPAPASGSVAAAELAEPVTLESVAYRPLPAHSALGLSAFYIALLTLMCGFLGGTIVNVTVDAATGYATTEIGPKWSQRAPLPINRWQTLLTKWGMALPVTGLLCAVVLLVAAALLGMDAPTPFLLWLFMWLAAASVACGTLVLFAILGSQGQLIAMLLFVYLGLASAGGTVPIQALPGVLRLVSELEPLRQILAGVRSILYFGADDGAGLSRGLITASAGLLFWLALGALVVRWYDSRRLHRLQPEVLAHVQESISAYKAAKPPAPAAPADQGPQT